MYVITEKESYEFEYPLVIANTIDEAKDKAIEFLKSRSKMIDYFNIYEMKTKLEEYPTALMSLGRDGIFRDEENEQIKGNK